MQQVVVKFEENAHSPSLYQQPPSPKLKPKKNKCFEKWSMNQNLLYIQFLEEHKDKLGCEFDRRSTRIFSLMSKSIMTRTSQQCRTHHQKMVQQCESIEQIIEKMLLKKEKLKAIKEPKKRGRKPKNQRSEPSEEFEKIEKRSEMKTDDASNRNGIQYGDGIAIVIIDLDQFEYL